MKRYFTKEHEWIQPESDTVYRIGITKHACDELGDIVFLELPETGRSITRGEAVAVVESVKAASDINAPLNGTVSDVNSALTEKPESLPDDPEGKHWLFKIDISGAQEPPTSGDEHILDEAEYKAFTAEI